MEKIIYDIDEIQGRNSEDHNKKLTTRVKDINNEVLFEFSFVVIFDEFCCGITSLGDFSMYEYSVTEEKYKKKLIKNTFTKFLTDYYGEVNNKGICMFTVLDNKIGNLIQSSLYRHQQFKKVHTFKNISSGNINYIYLNKN